jgi:hypothetical protein
LLHAQHFKDSAFELPLCAWLRERFAADDEDILNPIPQSHDLGSLQVDCVRHEYLRKIAQKPRAIGCDHFQAPTLAALVWM